MSDNHFGHRTSDIPDIYVPDIYVFQPLKYYFILHNLLHKNTKAGVTTELNSNYGPQQLHTTLQQKVNTNLDHSATWTS